MLSVSSLRPFPCRPATTIQAQQWGIERGRAFAQQNCARSHAIGLVGDSPLLKAPLFRTLRQRYPTVLIRNTAMTNCSTVASIRENAHPPAVAPKTAPGTYHRTICQSM